MDGAGIQIVMGSFSKDELEVGMFWWCHPWAFLRSFGRTPLGGKYPTIDAIDDAIPERGRSQSYVDEETAPPFGDTGADLQGSALDASQVPAGPSGVFNFSTKDGDEVERKHGEQQSHFIFFKALVGEAIADVVLEFADPIFESASWTILFERLVSGHLFFCPVGNEKEVMREESQLSCFWVRFVNDNQDDSLGIFPGVALRTIRAELHGEFIALLGRSADGPVEVGKGHSVENGVILYPGYEFHFVIGQPIHDRAFYKSGVEADIEMIGHSGTTAQGVTNKPKASRSGVHRSASEDCVNKPIAQSFVVIISVGGKSRDYRVVDLRLVISVVARARLVSVSHHGKAVDVESASNHATIIACSP